MRSHRTKKSPKLEGIAHEDTATLLEQNQESLRSFLISQLSNIQEVDDLLQETNKYLIEKSSNYQHGTNFKAWAFSVARYKILGHVRDSSRSRVHYLAEETLEALATDAQDLTVNSNERVEHLRTCLADLKPGERKLLDHFYNKNTSLTKLSKKLGKTASSLHKAISRTRQSLRLCIERKLSKSS